ncbi:unnamed protein product [Periconia digitata]|uniref:CHAT domain-containing protein n=1 Tax=Periconia digitata TaxID=1303443 RepID=A0A9W4UB23_9PLEO|nr:unnamed protein product [Periconia digitata]
MDFRDVCNIFGGTPFYDDLHTNIKAAHKSLDARVADAFEPSIEQDASITLLRAIICLLEGDLKSATNYLTSLHNNDMYTQQHPRWAFRAKAYSALLSVWRDYPPLLRPCNLRGPALVTWMNNRKYNNGAGFLRDCAQVAQEMPELDVLEYKVIRAICMSYHLVPVICQLRAKNTIGETDLAQHKKHYIRLSRLLAEIDDLVENFLRLDLPLVAAYLLQIEYDLVRASGDPTAVQYLDLMNSIYSTLQDHIGLGQYYLIQGDHSLSAYQTSPLVLNLIIVDNLDEFGGDSTMYFADSKCSNNVSASQTLPWDERIEKQCSTSKTWYAKAVENFEFADSARGVAHVTLRKACVLRMRNMQPEAVWGEASRDNEVIEMLHEGAMMAQDSRDKQFETLVKLHQLTYRNPTLEMRSEVHQMAHWARGCGNLLFALGLALFALRLGHYHRYVLAVPARTQGYEICRQITKEIQGFWTVWYHAMLAQLRLSLSLGNRSHAVIWANHLKQNTHLMAEEYAIAPRTPGVGIYTMLHILTAVVDAVILLGPVDDESSEFPDNLTKQMLESLEHDALLIPFAQEAWMRLKYAAAMYSYQRNLQDGQLKAAQSPLQKYLQEKEAEVRDKLVINLQNIDVLYQAGDFDQAKEYLSVHVGDEDRFPVILPPIQDPAGFIQVIDRAMQQRKIQSLEAIFLCCIKVKDWQRATRLLASIEEVSPGYFTSVSSYTDLWPWQRCLYAGLVLESQGDYHESYLYFVQARYFLLEIAYTMADDDFRLVLAKPEVTRLLGAAARRALLWKQQLPGLTTLGPTSNSAINCRVFRIFTITVPYKDPSQHFIEGLVFLEAARPQYIWSGNGDGFTTEQVEAQYKYELWKELMKKTHRTPEEETEFQELHPDREKYFAVFNQTTHLRAKTRELSVQSVAAFFRSVPEIAIVLYIFATQDGCILLAIDNTQIRIAAFNPEATLAVLEKTVIMYVDAIRDNDTAAIRYLGLILSGILIEPLKNCIAKRGHVIFVMTGILTRLPVSALRYNGEFLILNREVSQVPSLRALHSLQSRPPPKNLQGRSRMSVIARPGNPRDQWLPMAGIEALLIGAMCATPAINAKDVDRQDFQRLIQDSQFLHICTHGIQDADRPFNSQIILKEKFRVLDMLAVRGNVSLVTFSACHSGVGHAADSGDIQGFSHSVLAAGANNYLGALWKVNDIATMIHMWLFYANLFLFQDKPSFSEAWQFSTRILYSLTTEEAIGYLEQYVTVWDTLEDRGKNPTSLAGKTAKKKLLNVIRDWKAGINIIDFSEPRIWAPFVMVGNASLRIWTTMQSISDRLLEFTRARPEASHEDILAHYRSLDPASFKPTTSWEDAVRSGRWEGPDEAPLPKTFLDPPWKTLVSYGGFEGNDEAPLPGSFDLA